ncbi:hypothetical protein H5410_001906 [Solanum commersonii]|uniref:Uncharacterized protein n=1 Tax=Solanum commersonii TaxID=4109 RepID=A0A9J6B052_SOLCO|nr:hypothetical protein H5410_001906 [Solanum commersonii]
MRNGKEENRKKCGGKKVEEIPQEKKSSENFNKSIHAQCGRYGHYAKGCRVKEKIKNLDIDDNPKILYIDHA